MDKRQKDILTMVQNAGLEALSAEKKGSRQWIRARAENGVERSFSISLGGKGDVRGDLNEQSVMKRFARENALEKPAVQESVEPEVSVVVKRPKPPKLAPSAIPLPPRTRAITPAPMLRPRGGASLPALAQALIQAEASAGTMVETVPEKPLLAPAPISSTVLPALTTSNIKSVMSQKAATPISMLTPVDFYKVCTWVKSQVLENCPSLEALAMQAAQHIGTGVTEEEMKLVMETTEITAPARWSEPTDPVAIVVRELELMMSALGHESTAAFQKLADKLLRDGKPA